MVATVRAPRAPQRAGVLGGARGGGLQEVRVILGGCRTGGGGACTGTDKCGKEGGSWLPVCGVEEHCLGEWESVCVWVGALKAGPWPWMCVHKPALTTVRLSPEGLRVSVAAVPPLFSGPPGGPPLSRPPLLLRPQRQWRRHLRDCVRRLLLPRACFLTASSLVVEWNGHHRPPPFRQLAGTTARHNGSPRGMTRRLAR